MIESRARVDVLAWPRLPPVSSGVDIDDANGDSLR